MNAEDTFVNEFSNLNVSEDWWIQKIEELVGVRLLSENLLKRFPILSTISERNLKVYERQSIVEKIMRDWSKRLAAYCSTSGSTDRNHFKVPTCVGLPGVGKTAILDCADAILRRVLLDGSPGGGGLVVLLLVPYFNGHSLQEADNKLPNTCTFAWRLLHRFLLERRVDCQYYDFQRFMELLIPNKWTHGLTITIALLLIKRILNVSSMSAIIAIDEYQSVPNDLTAILNDLLNCSISLSSGRQIFLYPLMAGTEWVKVDGTGSSKLFCTKIPVPFLSFRSSLKIASKLLPGSTTKSDVFVKGVATVGQSPRALLCFISDIQHELKLRKKSNKLTKEVIRELQAAATNSHLKQWSQQDIEEVMKLVAVAVARKRVYEGDQANITFCDCDRDRNSQQSLTWEQLASRGLLMLKPAGDRDLNALVVDIPLAAIARVASTSPLPHWGPHQRLFANSLTGLIELLDESDLEPWQQWEQFGAYFYAAKLNAFQILGYASVEIGELFHGLRNNLPRDLEIILKPTAVLKTDHHLSADSDLAAIPEGGNAFFNTVDNFDSDEYFVWINGPNAPAVDIFTVLQSRSSHRGRTPTRRDRPVLILDQRKRDAKDITRGHLASLLDGMSERVPDNFVEDKDGLVVYALFSALADFGKTAVDLPTDKHVVVYTRASQEVYIHSLRHHPSTNLVISPYSANQTLLQSFLGCSPDVAKGMLEYLKNGGGFRHAGEMNAFLLEHDKSTLDEDEVRVRKRIIQKHFLFDDEEAKPSAVKEDDFFEWNSDEDSI